MKLTFLKNSLIAINVLTLLAQLLLMGSFGPFFAYPMLTLLVPLICIFNLLFFLFWLIRLQWPFILFIGVFLIGFSKMQLLIQFPDNVIHTRQGVKVMSFNVRLFNTYSWINRNDISEAIKTFITEEAPDIICFQEYASNRAPNLSEYPYNYVQSTTQGGTSGLAIFSKKPLYNLGKISFKNSYNGGVFADFVYKRDTIRLYNVHFESLRINWRDSLISDQSSKKLTTRIQQMVKKQKEQVKLFNAIASESSHPSIVCTDLNNNAFSATYHSLAKERTDAFVAAGSGLGTTYHLSNFPLRIDYIFFDPKLKATAFKNFDLGLSDHEPISVIIDCL